MTNDRRVTRRSFVGKATVGAVTAAALGGLSGQANAQTASQAQAYSSVREFGIAYNLLFEQQRMVNPALTAQDFNKWLRATINARAAYAKGKQ